VVRLLFDARLSPTQAAEARAAVAAAQQETARVGDEPSSTAVVVLTRLDAEGLQQVSARAAEAIATGEQLLVVCSEESSSDRALRALAAGAADVRCTTSLGATLAAIVRREDRRAAIEALLGSRLVQQNLVGQSAAWRATLREVIGAARLSEAPVLLLGETGTGKELLARLVHTLGSRNDQGELVVVDCTTLTPELAASELFGHERGAFTGATSARRGAITQADGGTLFLDEVGELPLEVQAKLLRVLQEGTYKTVGGNQWQGADFRLVCATHRDLTLAVQAGRFRSDLYYRIAASVVRVPPLRERADDVVILAERFLEAFGCPGGLDNVTRSVLCAAPFPGNVRELRSLMQHAAREHGGEAGAVSLGCLPRAWLAPRLDAHAAPATCEDALPASGAGDAANEDEVMRSWLEAGLGLQEITRRASETAIRLARAMEDDHVGRTARRLGVTERALQKRQKRRASDDVG